MDRLLLSNGYVNASVVLFDAAAVTTACRVSLMNWHQTGLNILTAMSALDIDSATGDINSTSAVAKAIGTAASIRFKSGQATFTGAGALFSRDSPQAPSGDGKASLDISSPALTPQEADTVLNSNAGLSCRGRLVTHHAGGTGVGWENPVQRSHVLRRR